MHETQLIATIAIGFVLAFVLGYGASRLRLPPLVGYLIAGVFAGPFTPGLQADPAMAGQLAELGVILLMFGVGLHFSIPDLLAVRRLAVPGALGQIALATLLGILLARVFGWSPGAGIVFGLSLSVASTVVLLKALEDGNRLDTPAGRVAVGWLIVEDLAMVLALVLLPAFADVLGGQPVAADGTAVDHAPSAAGTGALLAQLAVTLGKVAAFVVLAVAVGPKVLPRVLGEVARTGSRELFTLSVLAIAIGIAFASAEVFGVSFALGAFFAGVVLSESQFGHRAAAESLPLQDAFSVLFFVSVGMLFDPTILLREPLAVLATLLIVMVGKAAIALAIVTALRYPFDVGLRIAASLAQIGEFSFILIGLGLSLGLLPAEGRDLVLAAAILSITLNKSAIAIAERFGARAAQADGALGAFGHANLARLEQDLDDNRKRAEERHHQRALRIDALVATFPLLASVPAEDRDALLLLFRPRSATPGSRIIRRGDRPDGMYFLSSGRVEVDTAGGRIDLEAGAFFGEMALLENTRRTADVTAVEYCELLVLERRDFDLFMSDQPAVAAAVRATADRRTTMNRDADPASAAGL